MLQAPKQAAGCVLPSMPDGGEGQRNVGFLQVRDWGMGLQNLRWEMEATGEREEMFHLSFLPSGYEFLKYNPHVTL